MPTPDQHHPKKTSFAASTVSGIIGYAKGAIAGVLAGGLGGLFIGAAVGGLAVATGGAAGMGAALTTIASSALSGAGLGAAILAPIGAVAGLITGVVRSREKNTPTTADMVNVAKISFAQGVQVGSQMEKAQGQGRFEQAYLDDKTKHVMAERQVSH